MSKPSGVVYEMIRGAGALRVPCITIGKNIVQGYHAPNFDPLSHGLVWTKDEQFTLILERLIIFHGSFFGPRVSGVCENRVHDQVDRAIDAQRLWKVNNVRISAAARTEDESVIEREVWNDDLNSLVRVEQMSSHIQRFGLTFESRFEPARRLCLFLPKADGILFGIVVECSDSIRCGDVDE
jgi:hypothetical protein